MSTDQLFSNGGQANSFDQLRDQLKEKDEDVLYLYDNSTSKECNDVMRGLEENRDGRRRWFPIHISLNSKLVLFFMDTNSMVLSKHFVDFIFEVPLSCTLVLQFLPHLQIVDNKV